MTTSVLITIKSLACGYNGIPVVRNVDLSVHPGEFYAMIGANGSGKSTFLKTVVGLLPSVGGTMLFSVSGGSPPAIGYIPQAEKFDPIFPISVEEVVLMGTYGFLGPGKRVKSEHRLAGRSALRRMGMEGCARRRFSELSGGQKQRVLLARALAANPALLVLDEPTSGVDPEAERTFMELIAEVNERGVAVLMASHNLPLVREFADQILWFHDGEAEVGATGDILAKLRETMSGGSFS